MVAISLGKALLQKRPKTTKNRITVLGVFKYAPVFSSPFGFCKKVGGGGGGARAREKDERRRVI